MDMIISLMSRSSKCWTRRKNNNIVKIRICNNFVTLKFCHLYYYITITLFVLSVTPSRPITDFRSPLEKRFFLKSEFWPIVAEIRPQLPKLYEICTFLEIGQFLCRNSKSAVFRPSLGIGVNFFAYDANFICII